MLKFLNWDLKALGSNFAFMVATLEAIFDPQNRQNRGFSRRAAGKNGGNPNSKLLQKTRPQGGVMYQF